MSYENEYDKCTYCDEIFDIVDFYQCSSCQKKYMFRLFK